MRRVRWARKRELLAHERAVDAVLAGDLGQQAAQLGGAVARGLGGAGADQRAEVLERDGGDRDAERGAGALQQPGAVLLEAAAAAHLGLDVGQARDHGVDVAGADRLALREHEAEQALGGRDLRVEVDEQLGFEGTAHEASFRRDGIELGGEADAAVGDQAGGEGLLGVGRVGALAEGALGHHVADELAEQDLLEAERGAVGLAVGLRAGADLGREGARRHRGQAGDAHRFTWLAMPIISSAVVMAFEASWNARWDSIIVDHGLGHVGVGGLERALGERGGCGRGGGRRRRRRWPRRRCRRPTAGPAVERTVTTSSLPTRWPVGEHGAVGADRDLVLGDALGDRDRRLHERAGGGHEPAVAVDVQAAVARERVAAVGQADAEEALALDGDVERAVGALERALREGAAGVDRRGARAGAHALGGRAARLLVDEVAEPDALVLVARRVRVGEIVGDSVHALLLRRHAGSGGVESREHLLGVFGLRRAST